MGLDVNGTQFLFYCRGLGVDFTKTAMIGRQNLHLTRRALKGILESYGYPADTRRVDSIYDANDGYAEQLFITLGARDVDSFDRSEYEGATHLHDMNQELPVQFKERYTTVLDGGSLEHVFNFPVALRNCMQMVSVGGHYLAITPANNQVGHGFYQFSPELFFSVFTNENGFELKSVIAFEDRPDARWYLVKSPVEMGCRVTLVNKEPVYLLVIAKRVSRAPIFEKSPQQSDYLAVWRETISHPGDIPTPPVPGSLAASLGAVKERVPEPFKRVIRRVLGRTKSGFDPRFFQPMDPTAHGR